MELRLALLKLVLLNHCAPHQIVGLRKGTRSARERGHSFGVATLTLCSSSDSAERQSVTTAGHELFLW